MDDEKLSVEETVEETGPVIMDDIKLSVEETGIEYYDDPEEVGHLGRNVVSPPNYNQEYLLNAQRLDYGNRIPNRTPSSAVRQNRPENCSSIAKTHHQNLRNQAISSPTFFDGVDDQYIKIFKKCLKQVPQEKKMKCIKEVLSVMEKHISA